MAGRRLLVGERPIGIYDSGVGGLTVWSALRTLTDRPLVYYGDTAHVPYGGRHPEEIIAFSTRIVGFLVERDCAAVVAACNTSSALALPQMRRPERVPVIGVIESAVEEAIAVTTCGRVGLLATENTAKSGVYQDMLVGQAPGLVLSAVSCPDFVPLVEAGQTTGPAVVEAVKRYMHSLNGAGVDTVILGCTHYPFLAPVIKDLYPHIRFVDPAFSTARRVLELIGRGSAMGSQRRVMHDEFWVSGSPEKFQTRAQLLLGTSIALVRQDQTVRAYRAL